MPGSGERNPLGGTQACQDCVPVSGLLTEVSLPSDEPYQKFDQQSSFFRKQHAQLCSQGKIDLLHKSQPQETAHYSLTYGPKSTIFFAPLYTILIKV